MKSTFNSNLHFSQPRSSLNVCLCQVRRQNQFSNIFTWFFLGCRATHWQNICLTKQRYIHKTHNQRSKQTDRQPNASVKVNNAVMANQFFFGRARVKGFAPRKSFNKADGTDYAN